MDKHIRANHPTYSLLPIYSGGLGNVASDQLKATSDLGVPVVGASSADKASCICEERHLIFSSYSSMRQK